MSNEKIAISLTGGLGNQLFQLAIGLYLVKDKPDNFLLESGIGKPRLNIHNEPEIASFHLPVQAIFFKNKRGSWLVRKSLGYVLRMGVAPRFYEKIDFIREFICCVTSWLSDRYFQVHRTLIYGQGTGFFDVEEKEVTQFLIGYFQTFHWSDKVYESLMQIKPKILSDEYTKLEQKVRREKVLAIHMRRGDYKNEENFGLLSARYYKQCISEIMLAEDFSSIWIYTDTPDEINQLLSNELLSEVFIVPSTLSTSETFELMRHSHAYIIANSTFSWWAAYLSYSQNPVIYAPDPWFRGMTDPVKLIPNNWQRVKSFYC